MARKFSHDRELSGQVRDKALSDILEVLKESAVAQRFGTFKQQMLLKLAGTVLPRLQEHTGEDGGAINISFDNAFTSSTTNNSEGQTPLQSTESGTEIRQDSSGS